MNEKLRKNEDEIKENKQIIPAKRRRKIMRFLSIKYTLRTHFIIQRIRVFI